MPCRTGLHLRVSVVRASPARASNSFARSPQRPVRIDKIRAKNEEPGIRDFEANFLRLLEKMSNGCIVEINETGTAMRYKPGYLTGGDIEHDCSLSRGIGYLLEPVLLLGLFGKKPLRITLRGITNHTKDPSVDAFRTVTLPLLKNLGVADDFELRIGEAAACSHVLGIGGRATGGHDHGLPRESATVLHCSLGV